MTRALREPKGEPARRFTGSVEAIARPGVATGFALAGIACREADDEHAAAAELERILASPPQAVVPKVGVVLVQSDLMARLPQTLKRRLQRRAVPLVVPFPAPAEAVPGAARDFVAELLHRAIGYRVRLT